MASCIAFLMVLDQFSENICIVTTILFVDYSIQHVCEMKSPQKFSYFVARVYFYSCRPSRSSDGQCMLGAVLLGAWHSARWSDAI